MNSRKILFLILVVILLAFSSCNKAKQEFENNNVSELPIESYPSPVISETQSEGYPSPKPEPPMNNGYPAPVVTDSPSLEELEPLDLISEFSVDEPARMKWCANQECFSLIGYETFKVLSYPDFEELFSYKIQENEYLLDISPDGKTYAITDNNADITLRNWEFDSEQVIHTNTFFMSAEFSPDGKNIMLTNMDEWGAPIFDIESGDQITTLTGFETAAPVYDVRYGQNSEYAVWISRATIQVSEISTNQLFPAIYHQDFIISFDLNESGDWLATSAAETTNDQFMPAVFVHDFVTGEIIHKFNTDQSVYSLQFSPDSSKLALATGSVITLVDMKSFQATNRFIGNDETISQLLFSPDGTILVSIGEGLKINFWDIK